MTGSIQGAGAATGTTSQAAATNPLSQLSNSQTFLDLLVAQLKYQDPLNPTSGTQFLAETAQLTEVQTITQLSQEMAGGEATGLIGKQVTATGPSGTPVTGTVSSVDLTGANGPMLDVGGVSVALSSIQKVQ